MIHRLYQLPNGGNWITVEGVICVVVLPASTDKAYPYRVRIDYDSGRDETIDCASLDTANSLRDRIAKGINDLTGDAQCIAVLNKAIGEAK